MFDLQRIKLKYFFHFPYKWDTVGLHLHIRVNQAFHPLEASKSFTLDNIISALEEDYKKYYPFLHGLPEGAINSWDLNKIIKSLKINNSDLYPPLSSGIYNIISKRISTGYFLKLKDSLDKHTRGFLDSSPHIRFIEVENLLKLDVSNEEMDQPYQEKIEGGFRKGKK